MSSTASCARPPSSSLHARRSRPRGPARAGRRPPAVEPPARRGVDAGVDGVGGEVEQQRRVDRRLGRRGRLAEPSQPPHPASQDDERRTTRRRARRAAMRSGRGYAPSVDCHRCAAASPSRATSRCRSRGRAAALQVLRVRDAPGRTCTSPTRSSALLDQRGAAQRQGAAGPDRRAARGHHAGVRGAARRARASRTSSPTSSGPASGRSSAGCCRTRTSACSARDDLARLREVTASQGLMLESIARDLVAHQGSPTKHPALRLETIRGRRRAADPVHAAGSSSGSARREDDRVAALEALAAVHAEHGHLQEVILQNFVPHRALLRRGAGRDRDRRGRALLAHRADATRRTRDGCPSWATPVDDRGHEAPGRRGAAADARRRHPGPAEPRRLVAGARRGGRDRPRRPVAPTATTSRPSTRSRRRTRCASGWPQDGVALTERLCVYPQYIDPEWVDAGRARRRSRRSTGLHPAPRLGAHGRAARSAPTSSPARSRAGRDGRRADAETS